MLATQEDGRAIVYDAGLAAREAGLAVGRLERHGRATLRRGRFDRTSRRRRSRSRAGRSSRKGAAGSLAVFPPPHRFFYPQDEAYNLQFVWYGRNYGGLVGDYGFGIRQPLGGDRRFVPWFNAPPGTEQHLGVFYLLTRGDGPAGARRGRDDTPTATASRSCRAT